ncbi:MAG: phosphopyruvate hydratase [Thermoplasmata archaeon]|nr:MAG: phosphopyruvate hydratase [Thermoplasmata archaeon]
MTEIVDIELREILDSRGNPTVEADVYVEGGFGRFSAPSGASRGKNEVVPFPKGGVGAGIEFFMDNALEELIGMDGAFQDEIDHVLKEADGTGNFSKMGGNVAVSVSVAVAKAVADAYDLPLFRYIGGIFNPAIPSPFGNVLGGGKHAVGGTVIQEFLSVALEGDAYERIYANALVHGKVKETLKKRFPGAAIGKGDEGAWTAKLSDEEALELVKGAVEEVSDQLALRMGVGLDLAASEFYRKGRYFYREKSLTPEEQVYYVAELIDRYQLYSVEDPLQEEDFKGFAELTSMVGKKCLVVGDDLFVTSPARVKKGIEMGAANAVLVKLNQIGTLTDTLQTVRMAHSGGLKTIVSHRSGETEDSAIAHLAVGVGALGIKTGAVGGERTAKLNELVRIEEEL